MSLGEMIAEFRTCYEAGPAAKRAYVEVFRHCSRRSDLADSGMLGLLAKRMSEDFLARTAGFDFCDTSMNHLMRSAHQSWPPLLRDVYIAFDAGELYPRGSEPTTIEPSGLYTRPMLEAILVRSSLRPTSE